MVRENSFADASEAAAFIAAVTSGSSLDQLNRKLAHPIHDVAERCRLSFEPDRSSIDVSAEARDARSAQELVNALASHAVNHAGDWLSGRTAEIDGQISIVEQRLHELRKQFSNFDATLTAGDLRPLQHTLEKEISERALAVNALQSQIAALDVEERKLITSATTDQPALRTLQQELERALTRYTDAHPQVKELRASIAALEKESAAKIHERTRAPLDGLKAQRENLQAQLNKAEAAEKESRLALQTFAANAIELTRAQSEFAALTLRRDNLIQSRAVLAGRSVEMLRPTGKVEMARVTDVARLGIFSLSGAFGGLGVGGVALMSSKRRRRIIRDARGLELATGMPVLAELPSLDSMDESARDYWAVETLERLRSAAGSQRRGCFVCGIISSSSGEGRSTWIDLLAKAGLRNGHRVFVISQPASADRLIEQKSQASALPVEPELNSSSLFAPNPATSQDIACYSLTAEVSHVRFQESWERAFNEWQDEQNAVILVELPSAATADGLLQSRSVPNVLWLGAANVAESSTTLRCVTGLRNTGCNLIGAALNMCPASARPWMALAIFLAASQWSASSQPTNANVGLPITNAISSTKAPVLDPWQEKLTLGPGDVVDVSLYGQADSARPGLIIGPDGRLSYLQATDVVASGLTVDELRAKLEGILGKFHVAPRAVIVPQGFHSKKYFMLGNVAQRGVFPLDRPTTIVEAVARAHGFASAVQQRSSFNLADLPHAFLMRRRADGEFVREPVDFEGLFQRGELQHNKLLAPDDYLYFPPLGLEEVYVLGEVRGVGVTPYVKNLSALGAIATRGGFTENAFRQRILIVRGSLQNPETFIVDVQATLRAQEPDFALRPRDIVYVSRKPWSKAQELLEGASSDFVRAVVVTWTGTFTGGGR